MRKRISSSWTYFYKRFFPALWIVGFGVLAVWLWLGSLKGQAPQAGGLRWITLLAWGGGTAYVIWYSRMLREVWLYDDQLIVSDYESEERVPLGQVAEVKETRLWNPKLIRLRLKQPGIWGDRIVFIAPMRFQFVFMNHPLAEELRALVSEAEAKGFNPGSPGPA